MDEVGVVDEPTVNLQQTVHLGTREVAVDAVRAEAPGVLVSKILEDERRQVGNVGTTQSADEMPKLDLIQLVEFEPVQAPTSSSETGRAEARRFRTRSRAGRRSREKSRT